jgi:DNA-binding beta-propeller fold protein YncE
MPRLGELIEAHVVTNSAMAAIPSGFFPTGVAFSPNGAAAFAVRSSDDRLVPSRY